MTMSNRFQLYNGAAMWKDHLSVCLAVMTCGKTRTGPTLFFKSEDQYSQLGVLLCQDCTPIQLSDICVQSNLYTLI